MSLSVVSIMKRIKYDLMTKKIDNFKGEICVQRDARLEGEILLNLAVCGPFASQVWWWVLEI